MNNILNVTDVRDAAMYWVKQGFSVVPLKVDGNPRIKWTELQARQLTEYEINNWFQPGTGIALVCGYRGLVAVDVDIYDERAAEIVRRHLPGTPLVRFGSKGFAALYVVPESQRHMQWGLEGVGAVELRGLGCTIKIPPTMHCGTITPYAWLPAIPGANDGCATWDSLIVAIGAATAEISASYGSKITLPRQLQPEQPRPPRTPSHGGSGSLTTRYAWAAIHDECDTIANTQEGSLGRQTASARLGARSWTGRR